MVGKLISIKSQQSQQSSSTGWEREVKRTQNCSRVFYCIKQQKVAHSKSDGCEKSFIVSSSKINNENLKHFHIAAIYTMHATAQILYYYTHVLYAYRPKSHKVNVSYGYTCVLCVWERVCVFYMHSAT